MSDDTGWTIDGESATEAEVVKSLATAKSLTYSMSIDGERVAEGTDLEHMARVASSYADHPTTASFAERLCYALAFLAVWVGVDLMAPGALTWVCIAGLVGMVMVNRRIGLERWTP